MKTPPPGRPTQRGDRRRSTGHDPLKARALLVGAIAGLIAFGSFGMVITPLEVHAADAAAPGGRLIVTWRSGVRVAGRSAAGAASGSTAAARTSARRRTVVVAGPGSAARLAAILRANPDVASVVPDSILRVADWPADGAPNDPDFMRYQADLSLIRVPEAWVTTTGTASTIVAILDTGYTAGHPDLAGVRIVAPFNEITHTTDVTDGSGHGTHVLGTIAARTNNGVGVAGIAPGVSIMPVKVCSDDGNCWNSNVLAGVEYAIEHGASVINLSLGSGLNKAAVADSQQTYDDAAEAGVVVVAAAGNTGDATLEYPASFNHVISVAATDDATTNPDAAAAFSTRNALVDIAAPGVSILSTIPGGGYGSWSGTSMATPHVTAVAALVRSVNPTFTATQVETALEQTAVDLGAAGRDDVFGYGRLDAAAALAGRATPGITPASPPGATPTPPTTPAPTLTPAPSPTPGPTPAPAPSLDPGASPAPIATPVPVPAPDANPTPTPAPSPAPARPTVTRVTPRTAATGVGRSFNPRVTFSVPVDGISIRTVILTDLNRGTRVSARVTYSATTRTATLIPSARLLANHRYRISVTRGVTATTGGPRLAVTFTTTFRTSLR